MMDPLEWVVTLGNVNVALWLQQSLGWVYGFIKVAVYSIIIALVIRKIIQLYRYQYAVNVYISGPERTLTSKKDRGMITKTKTSGRVVFRLLKAKLNIPIVPEKGNMIPMRGNKFFWQPSDQVNLYCYGNSEYSYTPIGVELQAKELKWRAVEPELGAISQAIKDTNQKLERPSFWSTPYGPLVISLIPFLIFGILLFMNSAHFKDAASTNMQAANVLSNAVNRMADNQCYAKQVILPSGTEVNNNAANAAEEIPPNPNSGKLGGGLIDGIPW